MEFVTSKDGTQIAYEKLGTGPALILVGGGLCDRHTGSCGTPLAKRLASDFTVYSYDRRGRGDSGDTKPYAVEREIEDIAALIATAGGSAYLYGMSSGGILAIKAAASGLPVKKVVVYEPPFTLSQTEQDEWKSYTVKVERYTQDGKRDEAVELFMTTIHMPKLLIKALKYTPIWPQVRKLAPTLWYDAQIVKDRVMPSGKLLIDNPVAVIDGSKSPQSMRDSSKALAELLSHGKYITLKGQTHNVRPKALAPAIAAYLNA